MSLRSTLIAVPGLRDADPGSLLVLTQDLMSRSLVHLEAGTLSAMFALAELGEALPRHLHRDLDAFARRNERELQDLPDGAPLLAQVAALAEVEPALVPARLRLAFSSLLTTRQLEGSTVQALTALEQRWAEVPPLPPQLGKRSVAPVERPAVVPQRLRMPDEELVRPTIRGPDKPREVRPTPAAKQDKARADWLRQRILSRLDGRREQGLKESVLVAATCHDSPYTDLLQAEVIAELRELKRQGAIKNTAGRWIRVRRLGW
ncbi:MAG: hypothetical protein ABIO70_14290 [Pseudomonadota bacterium]